MDCNLEYSLEFESDVEDIDQISEDIELNNNPNHGWEDRPRGFEQIPQSKINRIIESSSLILENEDKPIHYPKRCDVIMVLAGGLDQDGRIHEWVKRRLDLAIKMSIKFPKAKIVCLGGGTYHKPPILNRNGFVIHESSACAQYLIKNKINPSRIFKDWASYDTIANGYFSLINFTIPRRFKHHLIITSEFHMARAKFIYEWLYSMLNKFKVCLEFMEASDEGLEDILKPRLEREKKSLLNLINLSLTINELYQFHEWFYTEHKAYNNTSQVEECTIDQEVAKSY